MSPHESSKLDYAKHHGKKNGGNDRKLDQSSAAFILVVGAVHTELLFAVAVVCLRVHLS
jgi:hypothetical protein